MASEVTFLRMPRSKPKTSAEGQEQLSNSLARMASAPSASKRVPITEIGFGQCRFVVDDRTFPALCCGEATLGGSWCAHHRALVFVRVAAPNHRKPAQEPPKALAGTAKPVPDGPAKRPDHQAARPAQEKAPSLDKQKSHAAPQAQNEGPPAKGAKPSAPGPANKPSAPAPANKPPAPAPANKPPALAAKDIGRGAAQAGAHKESVKALLKGAGKQAKAAVAKGGRSAPTKKPEPSRKSAVKPSPRKASSRKGAAKPPAVTKKAAAGKGSAAKRPRPATKAAGSGKGSAAKRAAPAKKPAATRKGVSAKQRASVKKTTAAGKRKTR